MDANLSIIYILKTSFGCIDAVLIVMIQIKDTMKIQLIRYIDVLVMKGHKSCFKLHEEEEETFICNRSYGP